MIQPPPQDQWDNAFSKSHDLDPTPECWGLFAYSDAPPPVCGSGQGSFHWFSTEAELIAFVRDYLAWWNPAPSSLKPDEIAAEVQAIVDAESVDLEKMVDRLNQFARNLWQIDWCGQFKYLCEGTGEFPVKIRGAFSSVKRMKWVRHRAYRRTGLGISRSIFGRMGFDATGRSTDSPQL